MRLSVGIGHLCTLPGDLDGTREQLARGADEWGETAGLFGQLREQALHFEVMTTDD